MSSWPMVPAAQSLGFSLCWSVILASCSQSALSPIGNPLAAPSTPAVVDDTDPDRARVSTTKLTSAPFVVDWQPEYRTDLEVRLRRGPAVIRFTGKEFELLPDCEAAGRYSFVGVTPKSQQVQVRSKAELGVNFPLSALSLEARLARQQTLEVDLRFVGKLMLDRPTITTPDLRGRCSTATHFVSAATVGAFAFVAKAGNVAGAGAKVLGVGGSAELKREKELLQKDGDFAACEKADPEAARPPARCAAILRVQVIPIDTPSAPHDPSPSCGEGLRWDGKACVVVRPAAAARDVTPATYTCDPKDAEECRTQCEQGSGESCAEAGLQAEIGLAGTSRDLARADSLFRKACSLGVARGCSHLGRRLEAARRYGEALREAARGCSGGDPLGCTVLGVLHYFGRGTTADRSASRRAWARACALREYQACANVGALVLSGLGGATRDVARASELFALACRATGVAGCANQGLLLETGALGSPDRAGALARYEQACKKGDATGCVYGGLLLERGSSHPKVTARALQIYETACGYPSGGGCATTEELKSALPGAYDEEGYDRRSCDGGDERALACYNAALLLRSGKAGASDPARAAELLGKACAAGMKKACRASSTSSPP